MSRPSITDDEWSLLRKGLSFAPMPQKIGCWYSNLLFFINSNQSIPSFSEVPAFKTPSKLTPVITGTQLELDWSEIEDEMMQIEKQGENYSNLTKKECKAMEEFMNECNISIRRSTKRNRHPWQERLRKRMWKSVNWRECLWNKRRRSGHQNKQQNSQSIG